MTELNENRTGRRKSARSFLPQTRLAESVAVGYFANVKARIRELLRAVPFQPFIIRMADGESYRIDHPDFVLAAASDVPQITIEERDGSQHYLSALLVSSIERLNPKSNGHTKKK